MDFYFVAAIVLLLYVLRRYYLMYDYWASRGIPHVKPYPIIGNASPLKSLAESLQDLYNSIPAKSVIGAFHLMGPVLILKDPAVIRDVCTKYFDHFVDRGGQQFDEKLDPILAKNMFLLNGNVWRRIRTPLTAAFTTSKMKAMFHMMNHCCENLTKHCRDKVNSAPDRGYVVDVNSLVQFITVDIIASCAFGVDIDSFQDSQNVFYRMALNVQLSNYRIFLMETFPKLSRLLNLRIIDENVNDFFRTLVYDTLKKREKLSNRRPDFLQLLAEIQSGILKNDLKDNNENSEGFAIGHESGVGENPSTHNAFELTDEEIVAQAMLFFLVGKETVNTYVSFTLYELARNPVAQERLQNEIDAVIDRDGTFTYDNLREMDYLDMCLSETLRLWPPAQKVQRQCNHPITLTSVDGDIRVEKGMVLVMPIYAIQRDPKNFPRPDEFDPERFNKDNKSKIIPYTYLPFGYGPRSCIGSRFALMESKIIVANLLRTFNVNCLSTESIKLSRSLIGIKNGSELKVKITSRLNF